MNIEISRNFKNWLDSYGRNRSEKRVFEKRIYLRDEGEETFDGENLTDVIRICQNLIAKYGDVVYDEHWTGYEDMEPSLCWNEQETDEQYALRISDLHEEYLKEKEKLRKDEERAKLEAEMKALQEKINKLK